MPYKWTYTKKKIPEVLDRRVKIPKSEHAYIRQRHKEGEAIRAIARSYKVDHRLIQFIIYPERKTLNLELRKKRGGTARYKPTKDSRNKTMRQHRHYKQSITNKLI